MVVLNDIINFLKKNPNINLKELESYLQNYNSDDWVEYQNFDSKNYKKNLIFRDENFEIIFHFGNHQVSANCELTEYKYEPKSLKLYEMLILPENSISYINNEESYHKILNSNSNSSISLHIYSPSNYNSNIYYSN